MIVCAQFSGYCGIEFMNKSNKYLATDQLTEWSSFNMNWILSNKVRNVYIFSILNPLLLFYIQNDMISLNALHISHTVRYVVLEQKAISKWQKHIMDCLLLNRFTILRMYSIIPMWNGLKFIPTYIYHLWLCSAAIRRNYRIHTLKLSSNMIGSWFASMRIEMNFL